MKYTDQIAIRSILHVAMGFLALPTSYLYLSPQCLNVHHVAFQMTLLTSSMLVNRPDCCLLQYMQHGQCCNLFNGVSSCHKYSRYLCHSCHTHYDSDDRQRQRQRWYCGGSFDASATVGWKPDATCRVTVSAYQASLQPALIIRIVSMEVMRRMNAFVIVVNFVTGKTPVKTTQDEPICVKGKEGWSPSPWLLLGHPWSPWPQDLHDLKAAQHIATATATATIFIVIFIAGLFAAYCWVFLVRFLTHAHSQPLPYETSNPTIWDEQATKLPRLSAKWPLADLGPPTPLCKHTPLPLTCVVVYPCVPRVPPSPVYPQLWNSCRIHAATSVCCCSKARPVVYDAAHNLHIYIFEGFRSQLEGWRP